MAVTTWDAALAGADHGRLRLYFSIEGIPYVFHQDTSFPQTALGFAASTAFSGVTSLEQGESRLNLARRRGEGGQLTIRLQDDEDGTLAALFAPRQYRTTFVTADVTETGDIDVAGVGGLPSPAGSVFIDGETVAYASIVGSTLTGCTRGAFGSPAQPHNGESTDGSDVFTVPPSWAGRRVILGGYFLPNNIGDGGFGNATANLSEQLGKFVMKEAPRHLGDDVWEIVAVDLIEELSRKKIGGGFVTVQLEGVTPTQNAAGNMELDVGAGFNFNQFVTGGGLSYVHLKRASGVEMIAHLLSQVSTDTIEYRGPGGVMNTQHEIVEAKHIAIVSGGAGTVARFVLESRLGDGANGSYDVMGGYDASQFGEASNRLGAGIDEAEVDGDAFLVFDRGTGWSYPIDDEVEVDDFMFDWCLFTNTAYFVNRGGELTVCDLAEDGTASIMTVDSSIVDPSTPPTMRYEEDAIYPRLRIECNYDPLKKKYGLIENNFDVSMQRRYPRREASLELKSKGLIVDASGTANADAAVEGSFNRPGVALSTLTTMLRRLQILEGRGRAYVSLVCQMPILKAELGSIVTINGIDVPDAAGGVTLSAQPARVVSMRPRYDDAGLVDVTFQLLEKLWRVAPACTITSRAGAVLTLNTADIGIPDAFPGRMFANTGVFVFDVSGAVKHQANVIAHTDTTITLDVAPAFANESNVDFVKLDSQTNGSGATSANGYVDSDFLYMMPDDENDGTAVEITRWR